jgi:3-methyladenine DNA glycosylase AlkD
MQEAQLLINQLRANANDKYAEGTERFGVKTNQEVLGVKLPIIRSIAKTAERSTPLANELWQSPYHDARLLATLIANPKDFELQNAIDWIHAFDSWDICDQCCTNLIRHLPYCHELILQYHNAQEEYVKRFAFAQIAVCATHWKKVPDDYFFQFFPIIIKQSSDNRNFVKKAVNWALRQMGKRSKTLHQHAMKCCQELLQEPNSTAHWIAKDAIKDIENRF